MGRNTKRQVILKDGLVITQHRLVLDINRDRKFTIADESGKVWKNLLDCELIRTINLIRLNSL